MTAGFAKVEITPSPGVRLAGYAARPGPAAGVHDPLFARALVLESAGRAVALVSVEVVALDAAFINGVRERIPRRNGIPADAVLIAATHTHSGPVTINAFFNDGEEPEPGYMEFLAAALERGVAEAWQSRFDARLGVGSCMVGGVGANRRDPQHGPVDRQAAIIRVDDVAGTTRAAAVVYGCHPTVLGFDNLLVTGDYPGVALDAIEAALGPGSAALFFNGAEGNVSVNHASELNAIGVVTPGRTFERARAVGARLAAAVLEALPGIATDAAPALGAATIPLELAGRYYPEAPARPHLSAAEAPGREAAMRAARARELYASIDRANARRLAAAGGRIPLPVQVLHIAGTDFVGIPAEPFAETSLAIRRAAPRPAFVIGLANGYAGYLPVPDAFGAPGYEAAVAACAPDEEPRLVAAVTGFLASWHPESP